MDPLKAGEFFFFMETVAYFLGSDCFPLRCYNAEKLLFIFSVISFATINNLRFYNLS